MQRFGEVIVLDEELYPDGSLQPSTPFSAGIDLRVQHDTEIYAGEVKEIRVGLRLWQGNQHSVGFVLPRSGKGTEGLVLANTVGVIDADYQGEMIVQAWNRNPSVVISQGIHAYPGQHCFRLKRGDRICQIVFLPVIVMQFRQVSDFSELTGRGSGGFGSSGK